MNREKTQEPLLEAIIIYPNERTDDKRNLVNIIASQAKKKERTDQDIIVRSINYIGELGVFVAIYESPFKTRSITPLEARGGKGSRK